jgi:hypothetical protein
LVWVYGVQELNQYHLKGAKTKIDNPTSTEMPFNLGLSTSVLVLDGFDIESNVNNALFTITSGTLVLKNCKFGQTANQPVFNISAGAKVVLENTHFIGHPSNVLTTGAGVIVSKKSTSNIAIGTAVVKGDLTISKFYDENLNQAELSFANPLNFSFEQQANQIANPNDLRFALSETEYVLLGGNDSFTRGGKTFTVFNDPTNHWVVIETVLNDGEPAISLGYDLVPSGYVLGL